MHTSKSENGFCSMTFAFIWTTLHIFSLAYAPYPTTLEREGYTQWFLLFGVTLPCGACKKNFKKNLDAIKFHPIIDMCSRTAFAKCVWRLHNEVNRVLGKKIFISFEDMNEFYEQLRATDCDDESCKLPQFEPRCSIRFVPYDESTNTTTTIDEKCIQNDGFKTCMIPTKIL